MLDENEVETLIADPTKTIIEPIVWTVSDGHYKFAVPVENAGGYPLEFRGTANLYMPQTRYSLILLLYKRRVRSLCWKEHTNPHPDRRKVSGLHKHRWTNQYRDKFAYTPDDIFHRRVDDVVPEFLAESHIKLLAEYSSPPGRQHVIWESEGLRW